LNTFFMSLNELPPVMVLAFFSIVFRLAMAAREFPSVFQTWIGDKKRRGGVVLDAVRLD